MGAPRHRRHRWRREIDESKVDMGLIAPVSREAIDLSLYAAVLDSDHRGIRDLAFLKPDADMRVCAMAPSRPLSRCCNSAPIRC